jgi:hypothetical protein
MSLENNLPEYSLRSTLENKCPNKQIKVFVGKWHSTRTKLEFFLAFNLTKKKKLRAFGRKCHVNTAIYKLREETQSKYAEIIGFRISSSETFRPKKHSCFKKNLDSDKSETGYISLLYEQLVSRVVQPPPPPLLGESKFKKHRLF